MHYSDKYMAYMGLAPRRIPHWESFSCPDAETYITGIDYFEHPRSCRLKMRELYPQLDLAIPDTDDPKPRPGNKHDPGRNTVRWGDGETATWKHGEEFFKSVDEVLAFSPLEHADFTSWPHVVKNWDFTSEEVIYNRLRGDYPAEWGDKAPEGSTSSVSFYNTLFMWPLLTFGWELFLETCMLPGFERIIDEFARINLRVFKAFARLPVNFVICHDDIVTSRGPVCSPEWMHKYIFPRYEEFWGILRSAGKEVLFMADGCMDEFADDIFACGARGIRTEPYTDFKRIARNHKDCFLTGEGDNRILYRNNREEIESMVSEMVKTSKMTGGYMMGIGNHIPWNTPSEAVKLYLDLSAELACR